MFVVLVHLILFIVSIVDGQVCNFWEIGEQFYHEAGGACKMESVSEPSPLDVETQCGNINHDVACMKTYTEERCGKSTANFVEFGVSHWALSELEKKGVHVTQTPNCAHMSKMAGKLVPPYGSKIHDCNVFSDRIIDDIFAVCGKMEFESEPTNEICSDLVQKRACALPIIEHSCGRDVADLMLNHFTIKVIKMSHRYQFSTNMECSNLLNDEKAKILMSDMLRNNPTLSLGKCTVLENHEMFFAQVMMSCPMPRFSSSVGVQTQCYNHQLTTDCQKRYTEDACGSTMANYVEAGLSMHHVHAIEKESGPLPTSGDCANLLSKGAPLKPPIGSIVTDCHVFNPNFMESLTKTCGTFLFDKYPSAEHCMELKRNRDCVYPIIAAGCHKITADVVADQFSIMVVMMHKRNFTGMDKYSECVDLHRAESARLGDSKMLTNSLYYGSFKKVYPMPEPERTYEEPLKYTDPKPEYRKIAHVAPRHRIAHDANYEKNVAHYKRIIDQHFGDEMNGSASWAASVAIVAAMLIIQNIMHQ